MEGERWRCRYSICDVRPPAEEKAHRRRLHVEVAFSSAGQRTSQMQVRWCRRRRQVASPTRRLHNPRHVAGLCFGEHCRRFGVRKANGLLRSHVE